MSKARDLAAQGFEMLMKKFNDTQPTSITAKLMIREEPFDFWVLSDKSPINGNTIRWIPIQVLEEFCSIFFKSYDFVQQHFAISQDKGRFAATAIVQFSGCFDDGNSVYTFGNATKIATSIEMLELVTPLAFSSARSNALQQLGPLFGRDLNRTLDEKIWSPVPETQVDSTGASFELKMKLALKSIDLADNIKQATEDVNQLGLSTIHPKIKEALNQKFPQQ